MTSLDKNVGSSELIETEVPLGYWDRMTSRLRSLPTIQEDISKTEDIEPLV